MLASSSLSKPTGAMRPTVGVREISSANANFLSRERIFWASQLYGRRVCAAYDVIQEFRVQQGQEEDFFPRLCNYADLLLSEMVCYNFTLLGDQSLTHEVALV